MYRCGYFGGLYIGTIQFKSIFASEIFSKNGRYLTFFVQKTIRIPVSNKQARRKPPPIRSCT